MNSIQKAFALGARTGLATSARASAAGFNQTRFFHRSPVTEYKVGVVGGAGGIGQPLSLLMKMDDNVTELSVIDVSPVTPGVGADLSHIDTPSKCVGYAGNDQMATGLKDCDVVIIPAGVPRKPGMTRDDLFNINASINQNIATICADVCPNACFLVISNPVNSTVPIWAETLKKAGTYNKNKLFGVTTLDIVRANTFVAENQGFNVKKTNVNVIGGHAGTTILPLLSQVPDTKFSEEDIKALTHRIMFGGDEVVQAKAGGGSATLSMAYAGARFASNVLRALSGEKGIVACSYVESDVASTPFFSSPVELGEGGVEKIHGIGDLSEHEAQLYDEMIPILQGQIDKGVAFVQESK